MFRFPAGCSIEDVNRKNWMGDGQIINEPSVALFFTDMLAPLVEAVYHTIAAKCIRRFHQESVLKPETPTQDECESGK